MVLISGVDYISNTDECRALARQVIEEDFTDAQIQQWQYYNYSLIRTYTHKDDWDSLDREFGALVGLETKMTAADILEHYGDVSYRNTWDSWRASALAALTSIAENLSPSTDDDIDEGIFIINNDYVSYPGSLVDNLDAQPYRSTSTYV